MWTYDELDDLVEATADFLAERGAKPGSRVHVALTNSPAFVAVWLACAALGATLVPSDPSATARELAETFDRTAPVVGFGSVRRPGDYAAAADRRGLAHLLIDEDDTSLRALRAAQPREATAEPTANDPAAIMFTSGTTSRPKGVVVTQGNYAFAGDVMAAAAGLGADDRQLVVLPMFHANAQYYSFASAISVGASVALMHAFSASRFAAQATGHAATHASLFAAPIRMILARAGNERTRLRHCWYAQNLTDAQYRDISAVLGCAPRQLYGMTETVPAVISTELGDEQPGVMGRPTPGCRVTLQDSETGAAVPDGAVGEIVVGGRRGIEIFAEYLEDKATTATSFRAGWFRTGDLAVRDERGRYTFVGRRGDVLKVAGENVSTVEVEAVLAEHPAVFEVAVVGEPDPVRDEVPVAFVVLRAEHAGKDLSRELGEWAQERLSRAKRPREIRFVNELPRTSVGKIRKFLLTEPAVDGRQ
jgi:crotonobetaine/carnitine-CoA ligase